MTQLATANGGLIQPLNQSLDCIIEALIASKHKASTRLTYRQNLKYFAHYLIHGFLNKCQKIVLPDIQIKAVIGEFLGFEKVRAIAYTAQYQLDLIEADYTPNSIGKQVIHLAPKTVSALNNWLSCYSNPQPESPLFISLANNTRGNRLTGKSIYCIVRKYNVPKPNTVTVGKT